MASGAEPEFPIVLMEQSGQIRLRPVDRGRASLLSGLFLQAGPISAPLRLPPERRFQPVSPNGDSVSS
jgi:hypothetical protein